MTNKKEKEMVKTQNNEIKKPLIFEWSLKVEVLKVNSINNVILGNTLVISQEAVWELDQTHTHGTVKFIAFWLWYMALSLYWYICSNIINSIRKSDPTLQ